MPAADAAALLRSNATDPDRRDRPALRFGDRVWTHGEYVAECHRFANLLLARRPTGRARAVHVGVLLDNTPEYLFALGGAALAGAAVVGLNHTRRDEHLLRDLQHTDCDLRDQRAAPPPAARADRRRAARAARVEPLPRRVGSGRSRIGADLDDALAAVDATDAGIEPGPDTLWGLIFTSGTSDAPKAVICTQRRLIVTGNRMGIIMDLGADDIGYVCMPLFHSSALMVGWAPSLVYGASVGPGPAVQRLGLARRRPALRRDVHQLHGQAARVHPVDAGATRRRREHAARRVRQRGIAGGRGPVRRSASTSR